MEDYEEMLLQITDILKAHNRHHMNAPDHKQAIEQIKNVIFPDIRKDKKEAYDAGYQDGLEDGLNDIRPKGKWIMVNPLQEDDGGAFMCSCCKVGSWDYNNSYHFCPNCGARMEEYKKEEIKNEHD